MQAITYSKENGFSYDLNCPEVLDYYMSEQYGLDWKNEPVNRIANIIRIIGIKSQLQKTKKSSNKFR